MPLAGKPMLTPCAKHVVAKAASKAATENLILVVAIGDSLEFVGSLYKKLDKPENNIIAIDSQVIAFLF